MRIFGNLQSNGDPMKLPDQKTNKFSEMASNQSLFTVNGYEEFIK